MRMFGRQDRIEKELKASRPQPRRELVDGLVSMMRPDPARRPSRSLRAGVAVALTLAMLGVLAGFGSLSYAASGVTQAVKAAVHVVAPASKASSSTALSSAKAQYLTAFCLRGRTIYADSHATAGLTRAGAKPGACTGRAFTPRGATAIMACYKGQNIRIDRRDLAALQKLGFKKGFCKK